MKYRKKPIVIEATQWFKNGDHPLDGPSELDGKVVRYFCLPCDPGTRPCEKCGKAMREHGWIDTLEGGHIVCPGDWVITGVAEEHYPCKPDIFAATYDAVEGESQLNSDETSAIKNIPVEALQKAIFVFPDGDAWCAVRSNFINLQESTAGFGLTPDVAVKSLIEEPRHD